MRCIGWGIVVGALLGIVAGGARKTQTVRAVDVLLLGPFLVWAATNPVMLSRTTRFVLAIAGAATVTFNALNFLREQSES